MKHVRWKHWLMRAALAWLLYVLLVSIVLHPYWAVTRTSGGHTLVVEGWMHDWGLKNAADLFNTSGYDRIVVTGVRRPFAYYLHPGDTLELVFDGARSGNLELQIAGLPGSRWSLHTEAGSLIEGEASSNVVAQKADLPSTHAIRLVADGVPSPESAPSIFIAAMRINGINAHEQGSLVAILRGDGSQEPGTPTYAHQGARLLVENGVPETAIIVLPTWEVERSKTFSGGRDMAQWAQLHGVERYDVATLAVHARRTWKMHRLAHGGAEGVGIVALDDPWCRRWSWWGNYYGWYQVLKESIALPAPWLVDRFNGSEEEETTSPKPL